MDTVTIVIKTNKNPEHYYKFLGEIRMVRTPENKPNYVAMDKLWQFYGSNWADNWLGTTEEEVAEKIERAFIQVCGLKVKVQAEK